MLTSLDCFKNQMAIATFSCVLIGLLAGSLPLLYQGKKFELSLLVSFVTSGVASPKIGGKQIWGLKIFDFRRITLFCLEKRHLKHKMTLCSKNWGAWPLWPPLATPMFVTGLPTTATPCNVSPTRQRSSWAKIGKNPCRFWQGWEKLGYFQKNVTHLFFLNTFWGFLKRNRFLLFF